MKVLAKHKFDDVSAWELGWSPFGPPMMTAHVFMIGSVLIDTGMRHMRRELLDIVSENAIRRVLLTHFHEDHSGNAGVISEHLGIPVFGNPITAEKMRCPSRIYPYQHLMWGKADPALVQPIQQPIQCNGLRIEAVHTPGHSRDHTVYHVPERGWLFSGDLFLSERIKYFRSDERIDWQIASLKKVLTLDFDALFCAHRPRPNGGKACIAQKLQYLEDFYGAVAELAAKGMKEEAIMRYLNLKEQPLIKLMCFGNVSMKQMVRSAIRSVMEGSPL